MWSASYAEWDFCWSIRRPHNPVSIVRCAFSADSPCDGQAMWSQCFSMVSNDYPSMVPIRVERCSNDGHGHDGSVAWAVSLGNDFFSNAMNLKLFDKKEISQLEIICGREKWMVKIIDLERFYCWGGGRHYIQKLDTEQRNWKILKKTSGKEQYENKIRGRGEKRGKALRLPWHQSIK